MWDSKIPESRGPEGVWVSPGRSWAAPGSSVALPGSSGKVAGGFGEVLVNVYEDREEVRGRRTLRPGASAGRGFQAP